MPKSEDINNYPKEYLNIHFAAVEKDGLVIPCTTKQQARRLQFDIYGWRDCMIKQDPELGREFKSFRLRMELNLDTGGTDLIFDSNKQDIEVLNVALGIMKDEEEPPTTPVPVPVAGEVSSEVVEPASAEEETDEHEDALKKLGYAVRE